jgi:hypothetical protein
MPWTKPRAKENIWDDLKDFKASGCFFKYMAPAPAKIIWAPALKTTTKGNPAKKNPAVVPTATNKAVAGEINIAIKIATWEARVKDAGSKVILRGDIMGITVPIAHRRVPYCHGNLVHHYEGKVHGTCGIKGYSR